MSTSSVSTTLSFASSSVIAGPVSVGAKPGGKWTVAVSKSVRPGRRERKHLIKEANKESLPCSYYRYPTIAGILLPVYPTIVGILLLPCIGRKGLANFAYLIPDLIHDHACKSKLL